jgi:lipid-A-disaccharide synthase
MLRIGIVAGESSGDLLGAGLINELRKNHPDVLFEGIGGPEMVACGCKSLHSYESLSIVGLIEALQRYTEIRKIQKDLCQYFEDNPPDIFIGIDVPDFNLTIARHLKRAGVRTVQYVSPQVWAWRRYRLRKIADSVSLILALFPFEADFYQEHKVDVEYVGHPLADSIPMEINQQAFRTELGLPPDRPIIAILPGSRASEVQHLSEVFIRTAEWCQQRNNSLLFAVPFASGSVEKIFMNVWSELEPSVDIRYFNEGARKVMAAADVVLTASGTATLEAMLLKRPMVVAYRLSWLNYFFARRLVKIQYFSLPNLLAGEQIIREYLQDDATPEAIGAQLLHYIANEDASRYLRKRFSEIHQLLRQDTNKKAAAAILKLI